MSVSDPMKILAAIHDGVFFVDMEEDEILDVNRTACELLGYERSELLTRPVSDIHPEEMDRLRELAATAKAEGDARASDLSCLRKDGREIPIEATASPAELWGESGLLIVVRDISKFQHQNHYIEVFDRVLRHNFRNRMNVVLGRAEYIEANATDEELAEQSELLCNTVTDLVETIDTVRTVHRSIQTDTDPSVSVDSTPLLESIAAEIEATHPSATVTTDLPESLPVRADGKLRVALEQVIENAVVHDDSDRPKVEIIASPIDQYDTVEIQVVDDGPGIPQAEQIEIANPKEISPLEHGSGLGLWATSMIVASFDGQMTIDDNHSSGTVVTIRLPRATVGAP